MAFLNFYENMGSTLERCDKELVSEVFMMFLKDKNKDLKIKSRPFCIDCVSYLEESLVDTKIRREKPYLIDMLKNEYVKLVKNVIKIIPAVKKIVPNNNENTKNNASNANQREKEFGKTINTARIVEEMVHADLLNNANMSNNNQIINRMEQQPKPIMNNSSQKRTNFPQMNLDKISYVGSNQNQNSTQDLTNQQIKHEVAIKNEMNQSNLLSYNNRNVTQQEREQTDAQKGDLKGSNIPLITNSPSELKRQTQLIEYTNNYPLDSNMRISNTGINLMLNDNFVFQNINQRHQMTIVSEFGQNQDRLLNFEFVDDFRKPTVEESINLSRKINALFGEEVERSLFFSSSDQKIASLIRLMSEIESREVSSEDIIGIVEYLFVKCFEAEFENHIIDIQNVIQFLLHLKNINRPTFEKHEDAKMSNFIVKFVTKLNHVEPQLLMNIFTSFSKNTVKDSIFSFLLKTENIKDKRRLFEIILDLTKEPIHGLIFEPKDFFAVHADLATFPETVKPLLKAMYDSSKGIFLRNSKGVKDVIELIRCFENSAKKLEEIKIAEEKIEFPADKNQGIKSLVDQFLKYNADVFDDKQVDFLADDFDVTSLTYLLDRIRKERNCFIFLETEQSIELLDRLIIHAINLKNISQTGVKFLRNSEIIADSDIYYLIRLTFAQLSKNNNTNTMFELFIKLFEYYTTSQNMIKLREEKIAFCEDLVNDLVTNFCKNKENLDIKQVLELISDYWVVSEQTQNNRLAGLLAKTVDCIARIKDLDFKSEIQSSNICDPLLSYVSGYLGPDNCNQNKPVFDNITDKHQSNNNSQNNQQNEVLPNTKTKEAPIIHFTAHESHGGHPTDPGLLDQTDYRRNIKKIEERKKTEFNKHEGVDSFSNLISNASNRELMMKHCKRLDAEIHENGNYEAENMEHNGKSNEDENRFHSNSRKSRFVSGPEFSNFSKTNNPSLNQFSNMARKEDSNQNGFEISVTSEQNIKSNQRQFNEFSKNEKSGFFDSQENGFTERHTHPHKQTVSHQKNINNDNIDRKHLPIQTISEQRILAERPEEPNWSKKSKHENEEMNSEQGRIFQVLQKNQNGNEEQQNYHDLKNYATKLEKNEAIEIEKNCSKNQNGNEPGNFVAFKNDGIKTVRDYFMLGKSNNESANRSKAKNDSIENYRLRKNNMGVISDCHSETNRLEIIKNDQSKRNQLELVDDHNSNRNEMDIVELEQSKKVNRRVATDQKAKTSGMDIFKDCQLAKDMKRVLSPENSQVSGMEIIEDNKSKIGTKEIRNPPNSIFVRSEKEQNNQKNRNNLKTVTDEFPRQGKLKGILNHISERNNFKMIDDQISIKEHKTIPNIQILNKFNVSGNSKTSEFKSNDVRQGLQNAFQKPVGWTSLKTVN